MPAEPHPHPAPLHPAPLHPAPQHPDWLHHHLTVTGPAAAMARFQDRAAGSGIIPWRIDFAAAEEDWFHRLMAAPVPGRLSLPGARILAGQLRDAAERRHALAVARPGRPCPFDLHALVPVPPGVLAMGPDHPDSHAWLRTRWGVTQALRHVAPAPYRLSVSDGMAVQFWSADWSPWQALQHLRADWPDLRFDLHPRYDPPGPARFGRK